jgi:hypothetical protein
MKKIFLSILLICLFLFILNVWRTHFWYRGSDFSVGVKNDTATILRGVELTLDPEGSFDFGSIAPTSKKVYVDPKWYIPSRILVKWNDGDLVRDQSFDISLDIKFKGKIWIVFHEVNEPKFEVEED